MGRGRQSRWDLQHMVSASTRLREKEYFRLRMLCERNNTTVYALVKKLLSEWMEQQKA